MANQEQLTILKKNTPAWHGWNEWRERHPNIAPDFFEADLYEADLIGADLRDANLKKANLIGANLFGAKLNRSDLNGANLNRASLISADFTNANLSEANLTFSSLFDTNFLGADFKGVDLTNAVFNKVNLNVANFNGAKIGQTIFGAVDLRGVKGLETVSHYGPSTIGADTILLSEGDIPEAFLRGVGLSDTFIEYARSLTQHPIEYYSCFISYSSNDETIAKRLYTDLQNNNVRCWFAPEDMKIGARIRPSIDESIRIYDKLLIILSQHSVASKWVEFEVEAAMDKEQDGKPSVLFPVRLDDTVMDSTQAWATHIKRTRNIGDFTRWKDHDTYQRAFNRLLRDLKAEV